MVQSPFAVLSASWFDCRAGRSRGKGGGGADDLPKRNRRGVIYLTAVASLRPRPARPALTRAVPPRETAAPRPPSAEHPRRSAAEPESVEHVGAAPRRLVSSLDPSLPPVLAITADKVQTVSTNPAPRSAAPRRCRGRALGPSRAVAPPPQEGLYPPPGRHLRRYQNPAVRLNGCFTPR